MSLELPGSYEKGHLMYHTVGFPEPLRTGQANKIERHIHDSKTNK